MDDRKARTMDNILRMILIGTAVNVVFGMIIFAMYAMAVNAVESIWGEG